MTEAYEFSGKTVEEAVEEGLKTLGLAREETSVEVLEEGKKGGLFSKGVKARVRVSRKKTDGERAVAFLEGVFERINVPAVTELDESGENIRINVVAPNSYAVIGHRGELLDALQVIAGAVANIGREEYERVVVDCENYREKREATLKRLAAKLADKAVRTGRKVSIEPMSPYERRIIHSALADSTEVKTVSEGKEPYRYIVVVPNNLRPGSENYDARRGGRRGGGNKAGFGRDRREGGYDRDRRPYGGRNYGDRPYNRDRSGEDGSSGDRQDRPYRDRREGGYDRERRPYRDREERPRATGLPRSKRQPYFGTYLGNSNRMNAESEAAQPKPEDKKDEE